MEGEVPSGPPRAPVFVADGRRRVVRLLGWSVALLGTAWLVLALSSLVGAGWVPSASVPGIGPVLPTDDAADQAVRAGPSSAARPEMDPVTTLDPPSTAPVVAEPTKPREVAPSTSRSAGAGPSTTPTAPRASPVPATTDPNPDYTARPPSSVAAAHSAASGDTPSATRPAAARPAPTRPSAAHTTTTHTLPDQARGPG